MPAVKLCTKCQESKAVTEFGKHKACADGLRSVCKECNRKAAKAWRDKNPERHRKNLKRYYEANKAEVIEYKREWRKRNPGRVKGYGKSFRSSNPAAVEAWRQVKNAKRRGDLVPPPACEICRLEMKGLHAHHADYSKPLDVDWLCGRCHRAIHHEESAPITDKETP